MVAVDGVSVFMGKLRRIHEFLTNTENALFEMYSINPLDQGITNRLYEVRYILDKFWEIIERE